MMGTYRAKLAAWNASAEPYELTKDDLIRISKAK